MNARNWSGDWPHYCPLPQDATVGILWEDLLKDASLMPERAAPQVFLRPFSQRHNPPAPIAVMTEPKTYIRPPVQVLALPQHQPKKRPKDWVLLLAAKRRRRR